MPNFEIVGIGKETKRKRTKRYKAKDEIHARLLAENDGTSPETITLLIPEPATERQVKYATDLGLSFPKDINITEMSDLISRKVAEDIESPAWLREFAREQFPEDDGIAFTQYVGFRALLGFLSRQYIEQDNTNGLVRLFLYAVINELTDSKWRIPFNRLAEEARLSPLVIELSQNPKVVASIKKYPFESIVFFGQQTDKEGYLNTGGSRRTIAFQTASDILTRSGIVSRPVAISRADRISSTRSVASTGKSGCLISIVLVFILLSLVLLAAIS